MLALINAAVFTGLLIFKTFVFQRFRHMVNSNLSNFARSSPHFYRVKKGEICFRYLTPLFFKPPSFQNQATYRYQSIALVQRWWISVLPKFGVVWTTPPLRSRVWKSAPLIKKSSINQPRMVRFRSNFMRSLNTWQDCSLHINVYHRFGPRVGLLGPPTQHSPLCLL